VRLSNQPVYRRRRRFALLIFVFLIVAVLYVLGLGVGGTDGEEAEQVATPPVEETTTEVTDEQTVAKEETT
jgi:hypothetical protein